VPAEVLAGRKGPFGGNAAVQKQLEKAAMDRAPTETVEEHTPGWWLAHWRGQRGLTGQQLAMRMLQVGAWYSGTARYVSSLVSMISRWEHDKIVPGAYSVHILAEALSVEVGELRIPVDPHYVHPPRRATPLSLD